jgi:hypothetical protein
VPSYDRIFLSDAKSDRTDDYPHDSDEYSNSISKPSRTLQNRRFSLKKPSSYGTYTDFPTYQESQAVS